MSRSSSKRGTGASPVCALADWEAHGQSVLALHEHAVHLDVKESTHSRIVDTRVAGQGPRASGFTSLWFNTVFSANASVDELV